MKLITQIVRVLRLIGLTFAHAAWPAVAFPSLTWPSKTALIGAGVAVSEALYRQYFPAGKPNGLAAQLLATYQLVKTAAAEANNPSSGSAAPIAMAGHSVPPSLLTPPAGP